MNRQTAGDVDALHRLLVGRHSARAFRPDPVPRAVMESAFELARCAPSWCNTQPWEIVVTEGEGTERFRKGLLEQVGSVPPQPDFPFPVSYSGRYRERRLETALQLYDAVGIPRGDRRASSAQTIKNFELFGAPHVALITTEAELGVYGAVDCGVFLAALLLALQGHGVAAVPQAALAAYAPFVREHFDLPESRLVVCGVSMGWKDDLHPSNAFRTSREELPSFVRWVV